MSGPTEIQIGKDENLCTMQDRLREATGELVTNVTVGEFYNIYFKKFPNKINPV
jgi:hypothetical protein